MEGGEYQPPEKQSSQSFDEQSDHVEKIKLGFMKTVDAVDIVPENPVGNPVAYCLGWGGVIQGCKPFYEGFWNANKRVISNQYPSFLPPKKEDIPENFSRFGYRNADALVKTAEHKGLTQLDLVGHSEGAGVAAMAALLALDRGIKIDSIVLVNPSGIQKFGGNEGQGKIDSILAGKKRLDAMMAGEKAREKVNPELKKFNKENFRHILRAVRRPVNFVREGLDVTNMNLPELTAELMKRDVQVGIVQAANDPFVPYEELGFGAAKAEQIKTQAEVSNAHSASTELTYTADAELEPPAGDVLEEVIEVNKIVAQEEEVPTHQINGHDIPNPLICSVPDSEDAGHLFTGFYPENKNFYVYPLVTDMLEYFRTGEVH